MNDPKRMPEKSPEKRKKRPEVEAPYVPEFEVPDPPVPNRAHTALSLGNFDPGHMTTNQGGSLGNFDTSDRD